MQARNYTGLAATRASGSDESRTVSRDVDGELEVLVSSYPAHVVSLPVFPDVHRLIAAESLPKTCK